jgi:hypothetical protein
MKFEMKKKNINKGKSTQEYLQISEIREDTLVMKDGTLRAVMAVSSTNYDLKSQSEQEGIIFGYQRFLNALDFPVQILMQSRKVDITSYVQKLKGIMERQTNELLRVQTSEYIEFINRLVENSNVMNKTFYCIVPYSISINPVSGGFFSKLFGGGATTEISRRLENFKKNKYELDRRVITVESTLGSIGLRSIRLNTQEIIELLYNSYNFESGPTIDPGKMGDIKIIEN